MKLTKKEQVIVDRYSNLNDEIQDRLAKMSKLMKTVAFMKIVNKAANDVIIGVTPMEMRFTCLDTSVNTSMGSPQRPVPFGVVTSIGLASGSYTRISGITCLKSGSPLMISKWLWPSSSRTTSSAAIRGYFIPKVKCSIKPRG